ncbi:uncharacterized protein [Venturia canescens]|uniref:uncharacterized protein n=1 Tax=Venturia canescens TaxID=32260 RepID=UPI001C9D6640|nr:uncharacterized protein LOC122412808 [Venturia canescens]XP_043278614.1 uncharacterized protein LOC122412808 [Venturia canescens]
MRKWYQACLATIALLSLGALVVYRHEYNKLRYVLEVLNYFGNRDGARCNETWTTMNEGNLQHHDSSENFAEPIPSWQRLTNEIYVYSAYRTNVGKVKAVSIAKFRQFPSLILSCDILYLENDQIGYLPGKLSYESIDLSAGEKIVAQKDRYSNNTYKALNLVCNFKENEPYKIITAVKFSTNSHVSPGRAKNNGMTIMLPVRESKIRTDDTKDTSSINNEMIAGVCVASFDLNPVISRDIADFITFHTFLGIDRFIVYDFGGTAPKFTDLTEWPMSKSSGVPLMSRLATYTTLPWNFPFSKVPPDVVRSIVHTDCLYRTRRKVDIIVTLTWDEYIVSKYHSTIAKLFSDFEKTDFVANRYKISTNNLCIDQTDDTPKIYTYEKFMDIDPIFIYRQLKNSHLKESIETNITTRDPSPELIVINRYEDNCDRNSKNKKAEFRAASLDDYVGKFSKLLINSTSL